MCVPLLNFTTSRTGHQRVDTACGSAGVSMQCSSDLVAGLELGSLHPTDLNCIWTVEYSALGRDDVKLLYLPSGSFPWARNIKTTISIHF